jgi:thioredoxin reductase (NADPH)
MNRVTANSLFLFIGTAHGTDWREVFVKCDERGFILTGANIVRQRKRLSGWTVDRDPFPLETGVPSVFAIGYVRHGSIKRVASSIGEDSIAIQFVHAHSA